MPAAVATGHAGAGAAADRASASAVGDLCYIDDPFSLPTLFDAPAISVHAGRRAGISSDADDAAASRAIAVDDNFSTAHELHRIARSGDGGGGSTKMRKVGASADSAIAFAESAAANRAASVVSHVSGVSMTACSASAEQQYLRARFIPSLRCPCNSHISSVLPLSTMPSTAAAGSILHGETAASVQMDIVDRRIPDGTAVPATRSAEPSIAIPADCRIDNSVCAAGDGTAHDSDLRGTASRAAGVVGVAGLNYANAEAEFVKFQRELASVDPSAAVEDAILQEPYYSSDEDGYVDESRPYHANGSAASDSK